MRLSSKTANPPSPCHSRSSSSSCSLTLLLLSFPFAFLSLCYPPLSRSVTRPCLPSTELWRLRIFADVLVACGSISTEKKRASPSLSSHLLLKTYSGCVFFLSTPTLLPRPVRDMQILSPGGTVQTVLISSVLPLTRSLPPLSIIPPSIGLFSSSFLPPSLTTPLLIHRP